MKYKKGDKVQLTRTLKYRDYTFEKGSKAIISHTSDYSNEYVIFKEGPIMKRCVTNDSIEHCFINNPLWKVINEN